MAPCPQRLSGSRVLAAVLAAIPLVAHALPGDTELVSEHSAAVSTANFLQVLDVSGDGRYVLFASASPAFVMGDVNDAIDLFVRDTVGGHTVRANVSSSGATVVDFFALSARISADGRYVAFEAVPDNVVPNDTNGGRDIFLRDLSAGTTELVSRATGGAQYPNAVSPSLSADGRFVSFVTSGPTVHVHDRLTKVTSDRSVPGLQGIPMLSGDGRVLVYRNYRRIVAYDRATGKSDLVNANVAGGLGEGFSYPMDVSADGRYVLFVSDALHLVSTGTELGDFTTYVRDRLSRTTERVAVSSDGTVVYRTPPHTEPSLSADGRYVAFTTITRDIDSIAVYDVFRRDRLNAKTWIASVNSNGVLANATSITPQISGDGRFIAFSTEATNLSPADPDAFADAYMHEFATPQAGALVLTPVSLAFGSVAVGAVSLVKIVKVSNSGTRALSIQWVGLTGTHPSQFRRTRKCPGTLQAGASCTVEVAFAPTSAGAKSAQLTVSTGEGGVHKTVALSGTGQ